jgi:phenylalanyl-tRNA synthetase beta subunit
MSSSFPHARRDVTFVVAVNFSSCPTPEDLVAVFKQYLL